jgi:hypothetical protein
MLEPVEVEEPFDDHEAGNDLTGLYPGHRDQREARGLQDVAHEDAPVGDALKAAVTKSSEGRDHVGPHKRDRRQL